MIKSIYLVMLAEINNPENSLIIERNQGEKSRGQPA